uniref:RRM domain-containing protein n=1 Tax=Aegilops tauschii subsp. strangulata TaxID=200361 RepID=A0A453LBQ1_AEGTS
MPSWCLLVLVDCPSISKQEVEEEFQKFGEIEGVAFSHDQTSAYINFEKLEDAIFDHRALNGTDLGARNCVLISIGPEEERYLY